MSGPLALVGGDELGPGNEPQDRVLVEAALAHGGPAYVLATAAAPYRPDLAVANAVAWFGGLGLPVEELPVRSREDARAAGTAARASSGSFFYLVGGDPRLVLKALRDTPVWEAIVGAWRRGAALAGSSAGAMAMAGSVLLPGERGRAATPGLGLVPGIAVIPHLDTFGASWSEQGFAGLPDGALLVGIAERTAATWRDGGWTVLGAGAVTLLGGDGRARRHEAGGPVELPEPN
ncbi:MAG: Type 1 glutamine amidotransferase-like domain-containing protein [Actinomycetota bacterium]